jgi:hypothetical protein
MIPLFLSFEIYKQACNQIMPEMISVTRLFIQFFCEYRNLKMPELTANRCPETGGNQFRHTEKGGVGIAARS